MSVPVLLLKDEPGRGRPVGETEDLELEKAGGGGIRCPHCGFEPGRSERWMCTCLHSWNTFETRGVCPGCGRRWLETQCPRCHLWSLHEAWYLPSQSRS